MFRVLSEGFRLPTFTVMRLVAISSIAADLMIVYDGEQALKLLRVKVDFIILDLAMPKFDGFMVLQNYRSSPSLAASGKKALALGATDFVTKPMRFQSYVAARLRRPS